VEFAFGDHLLDVARRELRRGAELIALEPQVFDLLVYLVQNRDRVVSKDNLLAAVWGGRIVPESTLTSRVTAARRAVGDDGETQSLIRTLPPQGFPVRRRRNRKPEIRSATETAAGTPRRTVDCRAPFSESERRCRAGLFRRRSGRRDLPVCRASAGSL
jgi:DNA-binding winged helix-turn-helix (wHTH) protein